MKNHENRLRGHIVALVLCLGMRLGNFDAFAVGDAAQLISVSITNGTPMMPRTVFTQTWTMKNTGTTTWSATQSGYTMNILGEDSLGAVPLSAKTYASSVTSATIGSGKSVAPGAQATFTMTFIAPEAVRFSYRQLSVEQRQQRFLRADEHRANRGHKGRLDQPV